MYLLTVNDKGCYRGKTLVDGRDGAAPVKVKPDTRLFLSYEGTCLMTLGFTPQADGRYRIMTAERRKPSDPDEPFWKAIGALRMQQCMVAVRDISAGEDAPVPVKPKELSPKQSGITCIKFRER